MKNIEIKAKINNIKETEDKAKELSDSPLIVIEQNDVFFDLPSKQKINGDRLKLRQFKVIKFDFTIIMYNM